MSEEIEELQKRFTEVFGDRESHLAWQITQLSMTGQPCDITRRDKPPLIDVKIGEKISAALMYGAGPQKLQELINSVELADGTHVSFADIWTVSPMPSGGFSSEELAAVDISEADTPSEFYGGSTLREVIQATYRPKSDEELDHYIRRFIAS